MKKIFLICFGIFLFGQLNAQVNLQTGSATFSLPVFSWQDHKSRLNAAVALNYNSGNGLKVSDVASNIGQGWSLLAGGVITRMQLGQPDDQPAYGSSNPQDLTKYPNGYLHAAVPAVNGCPINMTKYPIYNSRNQLYKAHNEMNEDRELDIFSFQFNGKAGLFVLDKTKGIGVTLGDSKLKITFTTADQKINGIRTTITSFTIQDVDGLLYKFDQKSQTKVLKENYCDINQTYQRTQPKFENGRVYHKAAYEDDINIKYPWIISGWYLSEVKDPLTLRTITYTYTYPQGPVTNDAGEEISFNDGDKHYVLVSHKKSITKTPNISSITYPDGHVVSFTYSLKQRIDLKGNYPFSAITVKYNNRNISQYQLNTTYFILNRYGNPTSDYQKSVARLCLKSIRKLGIDLKEDTPPYIFDYYLGGSAYDDFVPPPFFYAKDIWNYYNGDKSTGYNNEAIALNTTVTQLGESFLPIGPFGAPMRTPDGFNRLKGLCFINSSVAGVVLNAKPGYAKNGLLKQIIYPTGGTLAYTYAQNYGTPINSTGVGVYSPVGGVHVDTTISTDGGYSNGCDNPIKTSYNYVLDQAGNASSLWGLEIPVNKISFSSHYEPQSNRFTLTGCSYKFKYPGILSQEQAINLNAFQSFMEAAAPVLGVLSIVTTVMDVANVMGGTTGFLAWAAVVVDIVGTVINIAISCFHNYAIDSNTTVYYDSDLNSVSPLPSQFKRVEVIENPGTIGKTVYDFTNEDDYQLWLGPGLNLSLSAKQRFAPWAYGLPKLTTVFDNLGYKIKQVQNVYNFHTVYGSKCDSIGNSHYHRDLLLKVPLNNNSCKCLVLHTNSLRNDEWANPDIFNDPASFRKTSDGNISVDIYDLYTGRAELDTTYERSFKPNNNTQYAEKMTAYVYNDENYEPSLITTLQSDGSYKQKNIYYTIDYQKVYDDCHKLTSFKTNNVEINRLLQYNIISTPVETNELVNVLDGFGKQGYIYDKATVFTTLNNGDIRPSKILEGRFSKPTNKTSPWIGEGNYSYSKSAPFYIPDNPDYTFYKISQTLSYDANSNLVGISDEGNRNISNIYDYDDKYIVATVVNANNSTDKVAYSSFETSNFGGWTFNGSMSYNTSIYATGTRALNLSTGWSLSCSGLNTQKQYKLSLWSNNSAFTLSGISTLVTSGPTVNGLTYYEYDLQPGITSVSISTSGSTIDEVRLYPNSARMRTVTYDPVIGKTSECDENNRLTFYEYDNLGRLRFIKDEGKVIVKMYEYNNVLKQVGCPVTFTNNLISETFIKSNCGAGYKGTEVSYTVPAGKYTSSISQADADAKAENELLENGQNFADAGANGSCKLIYYNVTKSYSDTSENCNEGYKGGLVTYTVPAGRYSSIISQEEADQMAQDDVDANAWKYINDPINTVCTITTSPHWIAEESAPSYCSNINGSLPAHLFVLFTNVNPNSSTYLSTQWMDMGTSDACPSGNYYNTAQSDFFIKNNCPSGYVGNSVTYTVPAGKYSSTISMADANQKAINDVDANGQAYANANGTCTISCSFSASPGFRIISSSISSSGNTVYFYLVFSSMTGTTNWTNSNQVATINGGCKPNVNRTLTMYEGGRSWQVIVTNYGPVTVKLLSGTPPSGTSPISLSGGSYNY